VKDPQVVPDELQNYRLTFAYDGRAFMGWQRHGDQRTVQGVLESAILAALGNAVVVQGAGRTDRGAHAEGQVVSVALPAGLALGDLQSRLEAELPSDLELRDVAEAEVAFHARTSAIAKTYGYRIWNAEDCPESELGRVWNSPRTLDLQGMREAATVLLGEHDFASFATKTNFKQKSTVRNLQSVEIAFDEPIIEFSFVADAFLYKMVRNLVRAIVKVGEGRSDKHKLKAILEAKDRSAAPGTAPASGLCLKSVEYPSIPREA
jgi:tRNA pseudouridine38-40 synthase